MTRLQGQHSKEREVAMNNFWWAALVFVQEVVSVGEL